ncbi:MAG: PAS domain S-box protein [Ignavibacteria bacterium]|nr:MAG: PAS domain S-box protein [Ignavibacteria bacterium]
MATLFRLIAEMARKQGSVQYCSALKSSFGPETLAILKEEASVCLDFTRYREELYCFPIALRGRYVPGSLIPFRFERRELLKPPPSLPEDRAALEEMSMKRSTGVKLPGAHGYEDFFRRSGEGMILFDLGGDYRDVNAQVARMSGYSENELRILDPMKAVSPVHRTRFLRFLAELKAKRKASVVLDFMRKNGKTFSVEMNAAPVDHGVVLGILRDVSEHQNIEKLAAQKEEEYKALQAGQKQKEEELCRRRDEMELLREIIGWGLGSGDVQRILKSGLIRIMDVLGWEMGAIYSSHLSPSRDQRDAAKQPDTSLLEMTVHRGLPSSILKNLSGMKLDEGLGGFVAKTGEPQSFLVKRYPSYLPYRSLWKDAGISAVCLLPLISGEKIVGIVLLCSKNERKEEISTDLLSAVGRELGATVESAALYRQVKDREEQYESLVASIPDILYTSGPDATIEFMSAGVERLVGYAQKEFYRNKFLWLSLVHPDDKKILLERKSNRPAAGKSVVSEYRVRPKGKASYRWVRDAMSAVSGDGPGGKLSGIITDITDSREQSARMIEENRERAIVLTNIHEGVVVYDGQLKCLKWNRAMEEITGLGEKEVLGKHASITLPGYHDRDLARLLDEVLKGKSVTSGEIFFEITQTGKKGHLRGSYSPLTDPQGDMKGLVGILTDVTARRKLETETRESEQVLRNIVDTMADVLIITDLNGTVHQVNKSFGRVLGYSRAEALGVKFPYPWLIEEEMGRFVVWISNLRDRNWLHDFDMTWKGKTGQRIPMSLSTTLLRNSMGEPFAMLNIARDITERTRLTRDLEKRSMQIEMINRIIGTANQTMDFDAVFAEIAGEINDIVASDMISVGLLTERGDALTVYASVGGTTLPKGSLIPFDRSVSQFAVRENRPFVVNDFSADPNLRGMVSAGKGLRSQIALPITLKGKIVGTLTIGSREPYTFTEEHAAILQPLAQELGSIIDRVNLFEQLRTNNQQLLGLNELSTLTTTTLKLGEILHAAVPLLKRIMASDRVIVYLREPEETDLVLVKQVGFPDSMIPQITRLNPSNSITGEVVGSAKPVYITRDAFLDERISAANRESLRAEQLVAMAVIPLVSKDEALGALDLFYSGPHEFSDQEKRLLTLVGNQLGAAIENARLYGELRSQIDRLSVLYELSQQLTSTLDLDQIFAVVSENLREIVPFVQFSIDLYDAPARRLMPAFRMETMMGERIITPRVGSPIPLREEGPEWNVVEGMRPYTDPGGSSVYVPMLSKQAIMGILSVHAAPGDSYTGPQLRLLESVANLAAIALEKGMLYEETVRISQEIRQRNKELDDFTYVVSHDLKEPLISVEGFSRILQSDYAEIIQAEGREYLDSMVAAATRMRGLIDDLLTLSRMSRPMEAFREVPMTPVIDEIKSDMEFTIRQKKVRLVVPDSLPAVYGNETQLKVLFRNLIGNAIKFNDKPDPVVEITFQNGENNSYLFSVRDNGIGIEKEFYEKIFVIFQRLHRREQYEGSGAGLAIVKKIIELHHGTIWVESELGKGSTFFLTLPAAESPHA